MVLCRVAAANGAAELVTDSVSGVIDHVIM